MDLTGVYPMPESKRIVGLVWRPDPTVVATDAAQGNGAPFGLAARASQYAGNGYAVLRLRKW